ncbi:MAG: hypothetical protein A2045_01940 [Rhodocyclales bacterium GWA2_65_20]|nr:MAG: hypothetical protein A2045_01940 [Rhodocyclales bacterium GWA2_65_20]
MRTAILEKLGLPGIAGLGLLLFCLSFYFGNVAPVRAELASLESEEAQLVATAAANRAAAAPAQEAGTGQALPGLIEAPELLRQLNTLANKHGVAVERTAYQIKDKDGPRRLEVSMPLKVGYPALRSYLRDALRLTAAASLDELSLQRSQAGDAAVAAQVRLSYGFAGRGRDERVIEAQPATAEMIADIFAVKTWEPPPPPVDTTPPPPQAPPLPFSFLGRIAEPGKKIAFMLSDGTRVLVVRVGDSIGENYRLEKYENGQLLFRYRPMNVSQALAIGDQT